MDKGQVMEQLGNFLWTSTPLWVPISMALLLVVSAWQQWRMAGKLKEQTREIENLHQWADAVDECLDRLDWSKQRQETPISANTQYAWWKQKVG